MVFVCIHIYVPIGVRRFHPQQWLHDINAQNKCSCETKWMDLLTTGTETKWGLFTPQNPNPNPNLTPLPCSHSSSPFASVL